MSCRLGVDLGSFFILPSSILLPRVEDYSSNSPRYGSSSVSQHRDASRENCVDMGLPANSVEMPPKHSIKEDDRVDRRRDPMTSYFAYDVIFPKIELLRMRERINSFICACALIRELIFQLETRK